MQPLPAVFLNTETECFEITGPVSGDIHSFSIHGDMHFVNRITPEHPDFEAFYAIFVWMRERGYTPMSIVLDAAARAEYFTIQYTPLAVVVADGQ